MRLAGGAEAKRIQNNTAVTDVLLDEPVTAQEWRLRIYDDGTSPGAVSAFMNGRCSRPPSSPRRSRCPSSLLPQRMARAPMMKFSTPKNVPAGQTVTVYNQPQRV